ARKVFFFLGGGGGEGACDQHRANQHCPDRGLGVRQPHRTARGECKLLLQD
ncbi:unnamed protein product, partial [Staurois parvus]